MVAIDRPGGGGAAGGDDADVTVVPGSNHAASRPPYKSASQTSAPAGPPAGGSVSGGPQVPGQQPQAYQPQAHQPQGGYPQQPSPPQQPSATQQPEHAPTGAGAPSAVPVIQAPPPTSDGNALAPGVLLGHTYRIEALLARGGMGEVYRARHEELGSLHAIKVILDNLVHDERIITLFQEEAKKLRRVRDDAVVGYEGLFRDEFGRRYLVMELVDGPSLSTIMKERKLTVEEVGVLRDRMSRGLGAAHEKGIYHRDISPDNVIFPGGKVENAKIIDFGIAKSADPSDKTVIGDEFAGKYGYVSPEQLGMYDAKVDGRSDIYSMALTLIAGHLGRKLDMGNSIVQAIEKRRDVPDLSALPASLRPEFQRMLQPHPKDRPAQIRDLISGQDTTQGPMSRGGAVSVTAKSKRTSLIGMSALAVAVVAVGGGLYAVMGSGGATKPVTSGEATTASTTDAPVQTLPGVSAPPGSASGTSEAPGGAGATPPPGAQPNSAADNSLAPAPGGPAGATSQASSPTQTSQAPALPPGTPAAAVNPSTANPSPANPTTVNSSAATPANPTPSPQAQTQSPVAVNPPVEPGTPPQDRPVQQAAITPPPSTAIPTPPRASPAVMRATLQQILSGYSCAGLSGQLGSDLNGTVSGFVETAADAARLKAQLANLGDARFTTDVAVRGKPYCNVLKTLATDTREQASVAPAIQLDRSSAVYKVGQVLTVKATAARSGLLYVDYIDPSGQVVHLLPNPVEPQNRVNAGQQVLLGKPKGSNGPNDRVYEISPPYGPNMIVAISSTEPLFPSARPEVEDAKTYLPALQERLQALAASNADASSSSKFFDIVP